MNFSEFGPPQSQSKNVKDDAGIVELSFLEFLFHDLECRLEFGYLTQEAMPDEKLRYQGAKRMAIKAGRWLEGRVRT